MGVFDLMLSFVAILFGIGYSKLLNIVPNVFSKNERFRIRRLALFRSSICVHFFQQSPF